MDKILNSMTVLVDTREHDGKNQHILDYFDAKGISWKKQKLGFGDYSFMVPADDSLGINRDLYFDKDIIVERKANLEEFSINMTAKDERSRIKKELSLSPKHKVIVIENGSYVDMVNGNYDTKYDSKAYWASVHSLWHEFDVPFIFMPDSRYTGMFIRGYFYYYLRRLIK